MKETKQSRPFRKTFLANLLMMLGICVLIYWIFFGSLSIITRHNDVQTVPDLIGVKADSAFAILEDQGFEIKVDSIFDKSKGLFEVVDQQPAKGARVKSGRIIFLTINKANPPMVSLPNFVGKSYRTIELELQKVNLVIGDTTEVYDISVGTILSMRLNGEEIKAGTKVPEGTAIDFVISKGLGDTKVNIPELVGLTLQEALDLLSKSELNYDLRVDGKITDSSKALIYEQYPRSRNDYGDIQKVWVGDQIEIRYKQDPVIEKRTYLQKENNDDEIIDLSNPPSEASNDKPIRPSTNETPTSTNSNNSAPSTSPQKPASDPDAVDNNRKRRPTR